MATPRSILPGAHTIRGCWKAKATCNNEMSEGIHALARLDDEMNGCGYTSIQVSVSEGMIPHRHENNQCPSWTILMGEFQGG
eukprot:3389570-Prorocentrum_lima.AAC.1